MVEEKKAQYEDFRYGIQNQVNTVTSACLRRSSRVSEHDPIRVDRHGVGHFNTPNGPTSPLGVVPSSGPTFTTPQPFIPTSFPSLSTPIPLSTPPFGGTPVTMTTTSVDPTIASLISGIVNPLKSQMEDMKKWMLRVPGMPQPFERSAPTSYAETPFAPNIAVVEIPKKFAVPNLKSYDGSTDLMDHVSQYRQRMMTIPIPANYTEACMCKGFGSTLSGAALEWFINLPTGSITSFAQLQDMFLIQFESSRKIEKQTSDLYRIVQKHGASEGLPQQVHQGEAVHQKLQRTNRHRRLQKRIAAKLRVVQGFDQIPLCNL